ncbi:hypothetical protein Hypma_013617 [Hypsizygus marmoreus]|uniref:Uncharacterized protein n=1 Tax=Hypsizygus marmoreus TaxID=39966 RepID=A0A369JDP2_HYPMA|nr:hypothetical protein Hypma_013617 [Hypsizygus marmoreus]
MNVITPKLPYKNSKSSPVSSLSCSPDVPDVLPVSINSLPAELLLSIFTDVYMDSRVDGNGPHGHKPRTISNLAWINGPVVNTASDSESEMEETEENSYLWRRKSAATEYIGTWKKEHLYDPNTLFPYTLSFVCRRWRALAETVPAFWTRLVIYVDCQPTSLSDIQSQLDVTCDLPLEVTVRRRPDTYSAADPEEYLRCRHVIELLMPHVRRFRMFTFDVISSSSLPSLSDDFHGAAPSCGFCGSNAVLMMV